MGMLHKVNNFLNKNISGFYSTDTLNFYIRIITNETKIIMVIKLNFSSQCYLIKSAQTTFSCTPIRILEKQIKKKKKLEIAKTFYVEFFVTWCNI